MPELRKFDYWIVGDPDAERYYEFLMESRACSPRLTRYDFQAHRFYSYVSAKAFLNEHQKLLPSMKVIGMVEPREREDYGAVRYLTKKENTR